MRQMGRVCGEAPDKISLEIKVLGCGWTLWLPESQKLSNLQWVF